MFKIGDFSKLSQVTVKTLRYYDDIGLLKPIGVDRFTGPVMAVYYDPEYRERDVDVEVAVPVTAPVPETDRVKVRELPGFETAASVIHHGSYEAFNQAYGALMGWIEANGYRIVGPNREVYLKGPGDAGGPDSYVTEIQVPVAR